MACQALSTMLRCSALHAVAPSVVTNDPGSTIRTDWSSQAQHPMSTLKTAKADLFSAIIAAAGVDDELSNPQAKVTLLAPTDEVSQCR